LVAAAALVVAAMVLLGPLGAFASRDSCSSYPAPGALASAGAKVPASLAAEYSVFSAPQRAVDRLAPSQVASLDASGLVMSGTRFLGDAAYGGRIYAVPAEHLLSLPLAPPRCLSPVDRVIERESLPILRGEYRKPGLCIEVLYASRRSHGLQDCAPAAGTPYTLMLASGTPAFGLVPDGVSAVTLTYTIAAPRTIAVDRNFFVLVAPAQRALPCGLQWLEPTGNVRKVVYGCSYMQAETRALAVYRSYVASKLSTLRSQVAELAAAIGSGNAAQAKSAWLTAHMTWLDIGQDDGAYGCFGALGGAIDGLAAGHPLGTADPGFTGFHRIEFDLWTKRDLPAAARDTATLRNLLTALMKVPLSTYLPATPTGIGNWLLRPHEVLEDALRDSLTANDDYGSGTDLASITADVAAVRVLLSELRPVLNRLSPGLIGHATTELATLTGAVDATRRGGAWVSLQALSVRQRQEVDADVDAALETLAPVPEVTTSSGANAPPT
jgi:iron uptake system EfeUOB component EfeO/EfeM